MRLQMVTKMTENPAPAPSYRWLQLFISLSLVVSLAACSTLKKTPPAPVAPAANSNANSTAAQFQHALDLLQDGNAQAADAELHTYLKNVPDSSSAAYLVAQIETPLSALFPSGSFSVRVAKNDTLSSLARIYLGDSLAFYGLARYNGITVPSKVGEGQSIRIPKTAEAIQARARIVALAVAPPPSSVPAAQPEAAPNTAAARHKMADAYFQRGLVAFQHQDLDAAIANWDKTLAIDPNFTNAQLNRAQAIRLKNNLAKLRQ